MAKVEIELERSMNNNPQACSQFQQQFAFISRIVREHPVVLVLPLILCGALGFLAGLIARDRPLNDSAIEGKLFSLQKMYEQGWTFSPSWNRPGKPSEAQLQDLMSVLPRGPATPKQ